MKIQNLIHILIGIACVGLLPDARPLAAQSRNVDGDWRREQTTGQSGHGLPANIIAGTIFLTSGIHISAGVATHLDK